MRLVDGEMRDVLPGIHLDPAYDGHTFASQMVTIENGAPGHVERWISVGDLAYVRKNFTGVTPDSGFIPVGLAVGTQYNMLTTLEEILEKADGRLDRIIIGHETDNWDMFPSWKTSDNLHVAELTLAPGESSKRPSK